MGTPTPPATFADLLQRHRRAAGLTQEQLAERAHLSARGISNLERGVRRLPQRGTVSLLAEALGLQGAARAAFEAAARGPGEPAGAPPPARVIGPPLVGRAQEVALLARHLRGEGPPVLLLAGEPGIGKSRLLQEAQEQAAGLGWRVLQGGCRRRGGQEPYAPLLEALERALRTLSTAQLRTTLQGCAWLVRLLPELAAGPIEPLPAWTLPPDQERRLMFGAVQRFLQNMAGPAGTLLVLDDLQWTGADALDLLAALVRAAEAPLRVVGAYRDTDVAPQDPLSVTLADLAHARLTTQRTLAPLTALEVAHLLSHLLDGEAAMPVEMRERVLQRAGGVPFFVVSCADGLREGALVGGPGAADGVPWDLAQSLRQRVAALPEAAREVLGAAAVIGRRVTPVILTAVAGREEPEVLAALDDASRARLLVEEGPAYHFAHDVIREVVEGDLGAARRQALHRRAVRALEDEEARRPGTMIERLAYHSLHAGEMQTAGRYARLAGDRAVQMSAFRDALAWYEAALELLPADELPARADLLEKLGDAAYPQGDTAVYLRHWQEAQQLYKRAGERRRAGDLARRLGRAHWERGEIAAAFAHIRAAIAMLEEEAPGRELAMAYSALSQFYMIQMHSRESVEWGEKALRLAEQFGDDGVRIHALNNVGKSSARLGEVGRGLAQLEESLELARRAGLVFDVMRASCNLGDILTSLGILTRAAEVLRDGLALLAHAGWEAQSSVVRINLAEVEMELGHWDEAHELLDWCLKTGEAFPIGRIYAAPTKGEVLLRQGRAHDARSLLEEVRSACERNGEHQALKYLLPTLALVYLALGEADGAVAAMDRSVELARDIGLLVGSETLLGRGIEVYLQVGREGSARELLDSLSTLAGLVSSPRGQAWLADAQGLVAAHAASHEEAAANFLQAAGLWQQMACPYQEAVARRRRAESLRHAGDPAMGPEAEREWSLAHAIFRRLGAPETTGVVGAV